MKKILLTFAYLLICNLMYSQTKADIEYINETKILLNGIEINTSTTIDDIKQMLGEPEIYKEYVTGKTNYHYKEIGVSVHTVNGHLLFIGANFNWDGDKNFPETDFVGTFKINGVEFDKTSKSDSLDKIEDVEFLTVIPGFYISKPKTDEKKSFIAIGFKDDLVTQIGFEFH